MDQIEDLQTLIQKYLEKFIDYLPNLVAAILMLILGWWAIKALIGYLKRIFAKRDYDLALQNFVLNILGWALKILLFVMVISQLEIATTPLVCCSGAGRPCNRTGFTGFPFKLCRRGSYNSIETLQDRRLSRSQWHFGKCPGHLIVLYQTQHLWEPAGDNS